MKIAIVLLAFVAVASAGLVYQHAVPVVHTVPVVHSVPVVQQRVIVTPVVKKVSLVKAVKSHVYSYRAPSAKIAVVETPVIHHAPVAVAHSAVLVH